MTTRSNAVLLAVLAFGATIWLGSLGVLWLGPIGTTKAWRCGGLDALPCRIEIPYGYPAGYPAADLVVVLADF